MSKSYFVYILTNYKNTVLYTGITNDLLERVDQHKKGLVNISFTKKYRLYKLVWYEIFQSPEEAIIIEKRIKGWKRYKKINLIKAKNPNFKDLSAFH